MSTQVFCRRVMRNYQKKLTVFGYPDFIDRNITHSKYLKTKETSVRITYQKSENTNFFLHIRAYIL